MQRMSNIAKGREQLSLPAAASPGFEGDKAHAAVVRWVGRSVGQTSKLFCIFLAVADVVVLRCPCCCFASARAIRSSPWR